MNEMSSMFSGGTTTYNAFSEMLDNRDLIKEQYDVLAGHLPENYNEVVLMVNKDNYISDYTLYSIGLLNSDELIANYNAMINGEKVNELEENKLYI